MLISPTDLHYFSVIAREGSLTRAADVLRIRQPSLSLALQRLERTLGHPLLTRGRKGVAPTAAGTRLLTRARVLLEEWGALGDDLQRELGSVRGTVRLGCHVSVARYALPAGLRASLRAHPGLEIRLEHALSRRVAESVLRMELDLGVVVNPVAHPDLVLIPLCKDEVALWHAPEVTPDADPVICDPDLLQSQTLLRRLRRARRSAPRLLTTSSLEVATTLAAEGIGPAILPTRVVNASLHRGTLKRARSIPAYSDQIALVYRVENRKVRAITELASMIARHVQD